MLRSIYIISILIVLAARISFAQWTEPARVSPHDTGWQEPWVSNDGERLYVSSMVDIFMSTQDEPWTWAVPVRLPDHINSIGDVRSPCESPTGDTLYFTSWDFVNPAGWSVFFCVRTDTGWGEVQNAGPNVNAPGWHKSVGISRDGSRLLVQHTFLIFYHLKQEDGSWGPGVDFGVGELGEVDRHPSLSPDNTRLFFDRRDPNHGDVWESQLMDSIWQPPIPLPNPLINGTFSQEDDACMVNDGRTLIFRKETEQGHRLFYTIDTTVVSAVEQEALGSSSAAQRLRLTESSGGLLSLLIASSGGIHTVRVHNILGQEVLSEKVHFARVSGGSAGNITLSELPVGIYIVSVQTRESLLAAKYLVVH